MMDMSIYHLSGMDVATSWVTAFLPPRAHLQYLDLQAKQHAHHLALRAPVPSARPTPSRGDTIHPVARRDNFGAQHPLNTYSLRGSTSLSTLTHLVRCQKTLSHDHYY